MKLLAWTIGFCGIITGCAKGVMLDGQDASVGTPDGKHPIDAPSSSGDDASDIPDAPPDAFVAPDAPPSQPAALLLSEIAVQPTGGEFVEIVNPGTTAVDLSHYYLADHGNYFKVPAGSVSVDSADFIVKFPQGASIPAHGVITVSTDTAASFTTTYGTAPTYAITGGTLTSIAANGTPSLTNSGEIVVLFYWDGASDLVSDVDMMIVGAPTAANGLISKSGYGQDGPDAGATTSAYKTDLGSLAPQATSPGNGLSTKRISLEVGETHTGGNGLTGDDETSENTAMSWDTSYTAPTPGAVPAALLQ